MTRKRLLIIGSIVCFVAAIGVLAWALWPGPPPTTADQVLAVMMEADPTQLSEEELDPWMKQVASTVDRLSPHELQKLVDRAIADETLRQRFGSMSPQQREKMANLVSEEQRARVMVRMAAAGVRRLKAMPAPLRKATLRLIRARREAGGHGPPQVTKERMAQWYGATTPRQRAQFVRAMREMRRMLEEAGIDH